MLPLHDGVSTRTVSVWDDRLNVRVQVKGDGDPLVVVARAAPVAGIVTNITYSQPGDKVLATRSGDVVVTAGDTRSAVGRIVLPGPIRDVARSGSTVFLAAGGWDSRLSRGAVFGLGAWMIFQ